MASSIAARASSTITPVPGRLASIDIVRGLVMVLMAIDHVRVYSGVPAGGPTPGVFFTRWVTHFCAPAFVFFAGTSAFLLGRKLGDTGELAKYLLTRGLLLVVLELTLIRFCWTFNFDYAKFTLAGVIWMLGWCMVLMAGLVQLPVKVVGWLGLAIILLQQVFGVAASVLPQSVRPFWEFIYSAGTDGPPHIVILYVLVPWIGVMAAGYGFGALMTRAEASRRRLCLGIGLAATAIFLVAGSALALTNHGPAPFFIKLLNQQKYPASQLFLLMTLGPAILLLPFVEDARGRIASFFNVYGRAPMFYYLLHIPLIHVTALLAYYLRDGSVNTSFFATAPFVQVPAPQRWGLGLLYLVFAIDVALLYLPCKWYAERKAQPSAPRWMRYI